MSFEFLRNGAVYFEATNALGTYIRLHTKKDLDFNQSFRQDEAEKRTLHNQNDFFAGSIIKQANPANFSFSMYLLDEVTKHQHTPLDFLIEYTTNGYTLDTFNLYFVLQNDGPDVYYKIENAVFGSGSFQIPRAGLMSVTLQGTGTNLTRTEGTFPGVDASYDTSPTFAVSKEYKVTVDGVVLDNILGTSLEVQNDISWVPNATLQASLEVTEVAQNTIYPSSFTLSGRSIAGSISQYIDSDNAASINNLLTWEETATIRIDAGLSSSNYQFTVVLNPASFTNRNNFGEVMTQSYDFKLIGNPDLSTVFTY